MSLKVTLENLRADLQRLEKRVRYIEIRMAFIMGALLTLFKIL